MCRCRRRAQPGTKIAPDAFEVTLVVACDHSECTDDTVQSIDTREAIVRALGHELDDLEHERGEDTLCDMTNNANHLELDEGAAEVVVAAKSDIFHSDYRLDKGIAEAAAAYPDTSQQVYDLDKGAAEAGAAHQGASQDVYELIKRTAEAAAANSNKIHDVYRLDKGIAEVAAAHQGTFQQVYDLDKGLAEAAAAHQGASQDVYELIMRTAEAAAAQPDPCQDIHYLDKRNAEAAAAHPDVSQEARERWSIIAECGESERSAPEPVCCFEGNFSVKLHRVRVGQHLGFRWDADCLSKEGIRIVDKVLSNSLAEEWNLAHPGREVRAGDRLVKVNGKGSCLDVLTLELNNLSVTCEFQPAQPRSAAEASVALATVPPLPPKTIATACMRASETWQMSPRATAPRPAMAFPLAPAPPSQVSAQTLGDPRIRAQFAAPSTPLAAREGTAPLVEHAPIAVSPVYIGMSHVSHVSHVSHAAATAQLRAAFW